MTIAALIIAGTLAWVPKDSLVDQFEPLEYRYTGGSYNQQLFRYRLLVPRRMVPGERYPLLVWLHGANEVGDDGRYSLRWLDVILQQRNRRYEPRYFILVTQCPKSDRSWYHGTGQYSPPPAGDMLAVTYEILQKTIADYAVDADRVYLSGLSSGGTAAWEMALRYPDAFAALVPLASVGGDATNAGRLKHIPIWSFHNLYDKGAKIEYVRRMAAAVKQTGGNVHLTEIPSDKHTCMIPSFKDAKVMDWMLAQRRNAWFCWTPPGCQPWKIWHVFAVPGALAAVVCFAWHVERKRRKRGS